MEAKHLLDVIKAEGVRVYPREACGLVVSKGKKPLVISCENRSVDPRHHFMISAEDYAAAAGQGEIIGVWHTHVEIPPTPSDADQASCEATAVPWYIVSINKTETGYVFSEPFVLNPEGFEMPYLERPYVFGTFDCWTLVRDFYAREYEIALGEYPRIENFWSKGHNFFGENWEKEGFKQLIDEDPQPGDLFLIQTDNTGNPNHIAIYIGNDMIMHHCHGRLSRRDIYGGHWYKHTVTHLRHHTKC